jgi:hypothetical protein
MRQVEAREWRDFQNMAADRGGWRAGLKERGVNGSEVGACWRCEVREAKDT